MVPSVANDSSSIVFFHSFLAISFPSGVYIHSGKLRHFEGITSAGRSNRQANMNTRGKYSRSQSTILNVLPVRLGPVLYHGVNNTSNPERCVIANRPNQL